VRLLLIVDFHFSVLPTDPTRLCRLASDTLVTFPKLAKIVLVTPEKAVRPDFLALLRSLGRPLRFVVDEAHCILEWGDFRPAYNALGLLKETFPQSRILAMTGTASHASASEIARVLRCPAARIVLGDVDRVEISYQARSDRNGRSIRHAFDSLFELLARH